MAVDDQLPGTLTGGRGEGTSYTNTLQLTNKQSDNQTHTHLLQVVIDDQNENIAYTKKRYRIRSKK